MSSPATRPLDTDPVARLTARVEALEAERRRHVAAIDLLRELTGSLAYRDIVQTVARRMGHTLGLDRCAVLLAERGRGTVHLVASFEDPSLRNQVLDLADYPELRRALDTGDVVHIPDVAAEPLLGEVRDALALRRVRSITVVPLVWRQVPFGALFLRTADPRPALDAAEIDWARLVAEVTANVLRTANRIERLQTRARGGPAGLARDRERAALLAFLGRIVARFAERDREADDPLLPRAGDAELERLVGVALRVLEREATR